MMSLKFCRCIYAVRIDGKQIVSKKPIDKTGKLFAKAGRSANMHDRLNKHKESFGNDSEIMICTCIDHSLLVKAENMLLSRLENYRIKCKINGKKQKEIIMFTVNDIDIIKDIYESVSEDVHNESTICNDNSDEAECDINDEYAYKNMGRVRLIVMKKNGYINGSYMAKKNGKEFFDWATTCHTISLIDYVSKTYNVENVIIRINSRKPKCIRGSYIHPYLLVMLGSWCSNEYGILATVYITNSHIICQEENPNSSMVYKKSTKNIIEI